MNWPIAKSILILPGTALVLIPGVTLLATGDVNVGWGLGMPLAVLPAALGVVMVLAGGSLAGVTVHYFETIGEGTPAPWDPPRNLVVAGPYRYCRNPMLTGAISVAAGEAALLGSWWLLGWAAIFFVGNTFWFVFYEEPGLLKRFGQDYAEYKRNVGRWIPRRRPWTPE